MGYILDALLVTIFVICVVRGAKKGFFKSLMSLISGVVALLLAFTLTPPLSLFIKENLIIDGMTEGIESTFMSIAETETEAGKRTYDLKVLVEDEQFVDMMSEVGVTEEQLLEICERTDIDVKAQISRFARMVADPLAEAISDITAFIIIFAGALIFLKLITLTVGILFKLPVLKSFDKGFGVLFGILTGVFFVFVFAMTAESIIHAVSGASPASFTTDVMKQSILTGAIAKYNPVSALSVLVGIK